MSTFPGLVTAASPYLIPAGGAVEQTNLTSLTPGQLTVRGGLTKLADMPERSMEAWSYRIGSSKADLILTYSQSGKLHSIEGAGKTPTVAEIYSGLLPDTPTSFAQGRRNEVYVFQGHGKRPVTVNSNQYVRPIGTDPPTAAPVVKAVAGNSGYVARIDIIEPGYGYIDTPKVTIADPPAGGRKAVAVSRIADNQVNTIQVTDGGAGYDKTPAVTIEKPTDGPSFSKGSGAKLSLVPEFAAGDHNTGVVYWESYLQGTPLGVHTISDSGNVTLGTTFCTAVPPSKDGSRPGYNLKYQAGGLIVPACTSGSGTGAKMFLPLTDLGKQMLSNIYPTMDPNDPTNRPIIFPNPCGENFPSQCSYTDEQMKNIFFGLGGDLGAYFGLPQIWDFGQGYKEGDEVWAYIHTAPFHAVKSSNGGWSANIYISTCGTGVAECPYVFKGHIYGAKDTPPNVTVKAASPLRQRPLSDKIANPGSGYTIAPDFITDDLRIIKSEIDPATGQVIAIYPEQVDGLHLWAPEVYDTTPEKSNAKAIAILRQNFRGEYRTYIRYVNENVPKSDGGPLYSSLSPYTDIDVGAGSAGMEWTLPPIPSHATAIELWRTTANQKTTIFRVARIGGSDPISKPWTTTYTDMLSDWDLTDAKRADFLAMPITLSDGTINANRYGVPPGDFAVGVVFQDRLFMGVDTTGKRPNTLMYSEADEPESVPEINELILQTNLRDTDYVTALVPYAAALVVFQSRACHRLTYVDNPQLDANVSLLAYRGCLNQRCWDLHEGILYAMDDLGVYAMTEGGQVESISDALDDLFRRNTDAGHSRIDMAKRQWFFVRTDRQQKVLRVHVAFEGDDGDYPTRQLCYSIRNKAWWEETYPNVFTCGSECRLETGQVVSFVGQEDSLQQLSDGLTDNGTPVPYRFRSGNVEFVTDQVRGGDQQNPRNVSVTFSPTTASSNLNLSLYYNGAKAPRPNLARRDRGVGFVHQEGVPESTVDMQFNDGRGDSPAVATALFANKTLKDVYGNDRFVSICLSGEQSDAGQVALHDVEVLGVVEK